MNEKDNLKVFYVQKDWTEIYAFSRYLLALVLNVLDIPTHTHCDIEVAQCHWS